LNYHHQAFGTPASEQKAIALTNSTPESTRFATGIFRITGQDQKGLEPTNPHNRCTAYRARLVWRLGVNQKLANE